MYKIFTMLTENTLKRSCLACGSVLKGRADKKFCNDYCRNNYNNQQKSKDNYSGAIRNINNALLKNRKALESLLPSHEDVVKTTGEKLLQLGFRFRYHTHIYTTKTGRQYFYCYDYGYLPLDNDWFLVVRKREH